MKRLFTVVAAILAFSLNAEELTFGDQVIKNEVTLISDILASPTQYLDKDVTVKGTIVGVCEKRGCWVDLASDARFQKLRLKVQDGEMVFPMHAKGRDAIATGKLYAIDLNIEQTQRHLARLAERNGETFDPASVTEGMAIYQVEPTGVTILD